MAGTVAGRQQRRRTALERGSRSRRPGINSARSWAAPAQAREPCAKSRAARIVGRAIKIVEPQRHTWPASFVAGPHFVHYPQGRMGYYPNAQHSRKPCALTPLTGARRVLPSSPVRGGAKFDETGNPGRQLPSGVVADDDRHRRGISHARRRASLPAGWAEPQLRNRNGP